MTECVQMDPELRPSFEEIDDHLKSLNVDSVEQGLNVVIFPKRIEDALKEGRKIEPEHHDCVAIYFSEIVGFTKISSMLTPLKVSDMLDWFYEKFDDLSRDHDVFKIETIGD
eukprot:10063952-Ditylum_brightwellii.AAC.1